MIVGFSKLFADIIHSTVWREPMHVKVVWITMLAMADRHGQVFASIPGLADSAKVTLDECIEALEVFSSPDKYSRTKDYEGRRIVEIDGGWLLLNYEKFRERRDDEEQRIQTRDRVRRHRERARALGNDVTESVTATQSNDIQKQIQKQKAEEKNTSKKKKASRLPDDFIVTDELLEWAMLKRPSIDTSLETEKFVNYWTAKSGKDATKLDWNATWRNWILNAKETSNGSYYQHREQTAINERNAINQLREAVKEIPSDDAHHSTRQLRGFGEDGYDG